MKYTYFCEPGSFLTLRNHYVFIGDWIRPDDGCIVLQHGNLSDQEYRKITEQGYIRVFEDRCTDYTYIETVVNRPDLQTYRDKHRRKVGILIRKGYNFYEGHVHVYGRVII